MVIFSVMVLQCHLMILVTGANVSTCGSVRYDVIRTIQCYHVCIVSSMAQYTT